MLDIGDHFSFFMVSQVAFMTPDFSDTLQLTITAHIQAPDPNQNSAEGDAVVLAFKLNDSAEAVSLPHRHSLRYLELLLKDYLV